MTEFVLGFECGHIWANLKDSNDKFEATVHTANTEMIMRLAEATDRTVKSEEIGDGWMNVYFSKRRLK